jgi:hypothetical protein
MCSLAAATPSSSPCQIALGQFYPVWSKNSSALPVSIKLKFLKEDELIEGTGSFEGRLV